MTTAATEKLASPRAIATVVVNDPASRTLFVRLPDQTAGYERMLWREAYVQLKAAQESGWGDSHGFVFAHTPGARDVAHVLPADALMLKVHFPPGVNTYPSLTAKPVYAIVTVDRSTSRFLSCRFLIRP